VNTRRPAVRPETEYTYTDKSTGRQLSFSPKPDEAMVTFQERASEDTLNEVLQAAPLLSVSQGFNLDRGFAAVYVSPITICRRRLVRCRSARRSPIQPLQSRSSRYPPLPDQGTPWYQPAYVSPQREPHSSPHRTLSADAHTPVPYLPGLQPSHWSMGAAGS
jgi:hypothetical protein